jgi:hypothetical protein
MLWEMFTQQTRWFKITLSGWMAVSLEVLKDVGRWTSWKQWLRKGVNRDGFPEDQVIRWLLDQIQASHLT